MPPKLKVHLFRTRPGETLEAVSAYYVVGRKPAGGVVARVVVPEDMSLKRTTVWCWILPLTPLR